MELATEVSAEDFGSILDDSHNSNIILNQSEEIPGLASRHLVSLVCSS